MPPSSSRRWAGAGLTALMVLIAAPLAQAQPQGLRPLGGEWESARSMGPGKWVIEAGAWVPTLSLVESPAPTEEDLEVYGRFQALPAWPELRGIYGISEETEAIVHLGTMTGGAYRRHFMRAEAPWGGEYLQGLIQLGGGFHLAAYKPFGYIRFPAIYERGAWTFHVAPGGYYLFNQQPIADVNLGAEVRPWEALHLGGHARLRMDAKKLTPMDGSWTFGGGVRYQLSEQFTVQVEASQDSGPPTVEGSTPTPRIEFPLQGLRASATYYW